jgi:hypothetical protein
LDEVKGGVRYLKKLRLFEVSIVAFLMNELATIQGLKAAAPEMQILLFQQLLEEWKAAF